MIAAAGRSSPALDADAERGGEHRAPQRRAQPGGRHDAREPLAEEHAGQRADQDVPHEPVVDVARDHVRQPGRPQQHGRVEDVGPDDAMRREAEDEDQREADQRAAPDGCHAQDEAEHQPEHHGERLRARRQQDRLALALGDPGHEQRAPERHDRRERERARDAPQQRRVRRRRQALDQDHAADGAGNAAEREPARHAEVDRAAAQVPPAAERLGQRAVGDVGADRDDRLRADHEQQQRRHQRPAADAGEADQHADAEAEEDDQRVHPADECSYRGSRTSSSTLRSSALPVFSAAPPEPSAPSRCGSL